MKPSSGVWADLAAFFGPSRVARLDLSRGRDEGVPERLSVLREDALSAVREGASLLWLTDPDPPEEGGLDRVPLDPLLGVATVDDALRAARDGGGEVALRRNATLGVASDALRNAHDLTCALGLGADVVAPRLLWAAAWEAGGEPHLDRVAGALAAALRTTLSVMGIHEISGYGRHFSGVGLSPELAGLLGVENRYGGPDSGLTLEALDRHYAGRREQDQEPLPRFPRFNLRAAGLVREVASGQAPYADLAQRLGSLEQEQPVCLRHLLDLRFPEPGFAAPPEEVDLSIGSHRYPIFICPMSFGSQGETAFRVYAEVGRRLGIPCMNGEGGEIPELLGRYRGIRSQQVASGRFGVHPELLNGVDLLEIKIGQGAKPGEGGHLPGRKVTGKVAAARNATPGVPLISPSNHHDIYSIEDLAQLVEELRMVNPSARISVKVPVVSGIATIALGIAKAGADILALSGYDGGTGAARLHALRRVGLPVETGVAEVHRALVEAGLRPGVEVWADGGIRSALDVVKVLCLGADRVGFGTWALLGLGCVLCRSCHLDTCPRGISTQVETPEEALARGIKGYRPREFGPGVTHLETLLGGIGEEVRRLAARLGVRRVRDLVGRSVLLDHVRGRERLDLGDLLRRPSAPRLGQEEGPVTLRRPLSYLTQVVSKEVVGALHRGECQLIYEDDRVLSSDRALGTHLSGEAARGRPGLGTWSASLQLGPGSVPGNGLGAFNAREVEIRVAGGSQDGVGKGARGGRVVVRKGENHDGRPAGGCVGKGFGYGAQAGLLIAQGDADSRCGVRLSGADLIVGGRIREPLLDSLGFLADRANLKGFAFEYMTAGRAVVLGDPGPWLCSGMTGGVVYVRLDPELGLTREALGLRLSGSATVAIQSLGREGEDDLRELLTVYVAELRRGALGGGEADARWVEGLLSNLPESFVALRPTPETEADSAVVGD